MCCGVNESKSKHTADFIPSPLPWANPQTFDFSKRFDQILHYVGKFSGQMSLQ